MVTLSNWTCGVSDKFGKTQKYIFIYMRKPKKNYYIKKEKVKPSKWVQKEGSTCDDITFTNGEVEIDFDTWINLKYK